LTQLSLSPYFYDTHTLTTYTLSLHDALPISHHRQGPATQVNIQFAHAVWQQSDLLSLSQLHLERQQLPEPVLALSVKVLQPEARDRKSTRLNSSHVKISYAVFCLKKKITNKP